MFGFGKNRQKAAVPEMAAQPEVVAPVPVPAGPPVCQDCAAPISGSYCSNCGQETRIEVPTVRQFVHELLDQYVAVEGKLGRTLRVLLSRPGQLTVDYIEGRRQRYVRPLKLYVSISVVFFGLVGILPDEISNPFVHVKGDPAADPAKAVQHDTPPPPPPPSITPPVPNPGAGPLPGDGADKAVAAKDAQEDKKEALDLRTQIEHEIDEGIKSGNDAKLGETIKQQVEQEVKKHKRNKLEERGEKFSQLSAAEQSKQLRAKLADQAPYALFFLLPYFALLLRWFYSKNSHRYGVHLLFSVHLHCFAFILLTLMFLPIGLWRDALEIAGAAYVFFALRRVYGGTAGRTVWRMVLLSFFYFIGLSATALSGVINAVFGTSIG